MRKKDFRRFLKKYQSNQLNETGTRFIEAWYDSLKVATEDPLDNEEKASAIKNAMQANLMDHVHGVPAIRSTGRWYYAAACLLVLVCAVYIIQRTIHPIVTTTVAYTTIKVPAGQLKKLILPDSSVVWLNAGTEVRYQASTFATKRDLYLDEGEAFFTVVKDPMHPFTVHASHLSTKVLGTSFNVKAYQALEYASVQVKTGLVQVMNNAHGIDTITPKQSITYNKITGSTTRNNEASIDAASWMEGVSILQEASFEELKLVLYNRYRVKLVAKDPAINSYRYSLHIQQQRSVDEILKAICAIHQNKYRRENDVIIIY